MGAPSMTGWPSGVVATLVQPNFAPIGSVGGVVLGNSQQGTGYVDLVNQQGTSLTSMAAGLVYTHRGGQTVAAGLISGTNARSQAVDSEPGQGAANNAWLWDVTANTWSTVVTGQTAVIWPALRADGLRLVWAQLTSGTLKAWPFGAWDIMVADIAGAGIHTLENQRLVYSSTGLGEPYGFDDAGNILFSAPATPGEPQSNAIFKVADQAGATPVKLTTDGFAEFCQQGPDGLYYYSAAIGALEPNFDLGLELWRMNSDGTGRERLTYLDPAFGLGVCQICFPDPTAPTSILAGVKATQQGRVDCWKLTLP